MHMQHQLDMRRKDLYISEGKMSTFYWVGPETTILCWGSENIRNYFSLCFMVTTFKTKYFLGFSRSAASTSFPQGEDPQEHISLHPECVNEIAPELLLPGEPVPAWVQCSQDSLCEVEGAVCGESL